jgi:predicted nucleotidyltransferase
MDAARLAAARRYHAERERRRCRLREELRRQRLVRVEEAVARLAPAHPAIDAVYVFGSLTRPGDFRETSDIDLAVDCGDLAAESRFWRALEEELELPVDMRPRRGVVAQAIERSGEPLYERKAALARA